MQSGQSLRMRRKPQSRRGNRYCAVVAIDVKNTFNSASWEAFATALHNMRVPDYLCKVLKSYFQNQVLVYETNQGQRSVRVTAGVPQGSILGPTLWNIMYDGVLRLELPGGVEIVGFADDVVLSITGETLEEVEMLTAETIGSIEAWMSEVKLRLAHHKTEVVLVSNCKAVQRAEINVGGQVIPSKRALKHLGVMVDDRLNFNCHVDYACEKAAKVVNAVSRIMPNIGGPSSSSRRLLAGVSSSILRYGVPAWATALKLKRNGTTFEHVPAHGYSCGERVQDDIVGSSLHYRRDGSHTHHPGRGCRVLPEKRHSKREEDNQSGLVG